MKLYHWILGLTLICGSGAASAQDCNIACDPCETNCGTACDLCDFDVCDVSYSFYVDYLYWKPCRSDLDYTENSKVKYVNPDFDHGYRLGGRAQWKCWDLGVQYTSLCTSESRNSNKYTLDFDVWDVALGYTFNWDCYCATLRPYVGAKIALIDESYHPSANDKDKSDFEGYGLTLGFDGAMRLCNWEACECSIPVSLVVRCASSILDSEYKFDRDNNNDRKEQCIYIPVHEAFVGLDFQLCDFYCVDANFQIGYEVQHWNGREIRSDDDYAALGLGGLVVRSGLNF